MIPLCGGNWNNGGSAGVWALNFNNSRSTSNNNVGVRADSATPHAFHKDGGAKGGGFLRALLAKSEDMFHSSSAVMCRASGP